VPSLDGVPLLSPPRNITSKRAHCLGQSKLVGIDLYSMARRALPLFLPTQMVFLNKSFSPQLVYSKLSSPFLRQTVVLTSYIQHSQLLSASNPKTDSMIRRSHDSFHIDCLRSGMLYSSMPTTFSSYIRNMRVACQMTRRIIDNQDTKTRSRSPKVKETFLDS